MLTAVMAGVAYVLLATRLFHTGGVWLPVITPVFGQIPLALIAAFAWKYSHAQRQGDRVRRTLETYLPKRAVDELSRRVEGALPDAQLLRGTCLVTDAQNYTSLAERLSPRELQKALNAYYAVLFPEVERHEGFVADVIGDSMVAIWATPDSDAAARINACRAAIAIERSTREFNAANPDFTLPTRIGIHTGEILLGNVGTESHLEYRPIGDIVNTASRIQDFNKHLRTTLLVSEQVIEEAQPVSYRRLGEFLLAGKGVPIRLCDRISFAAQPEPGQAALIAAFDDAHRLFRRRRWAEAAAAFDALLDRHPADGPSEFYRRVCYGFVAQDPGPGWTGAITVSTT
jgi:adenylate cyclase